MAMIVKNNMQALNTLNTLNSNTNALTSSLKKVSSGMKINSAQDDASGYAISERMRVQIRSLDQAKANTNSGNSLLKVAEGAVSSTVDILKTLKEKVINAANDTNTDEDRAIIQKELNQSIDQINDNASVTFNGKFLVDGTHNKKTEATKTCLTNQSLATDAAGGIDFTALKNRNGETLNIQSSDSVTISFTVDGKTYTTTQKVSEKANLNALIAVKATAADGSQKAASDVMVLGTATNVIGKDGSSKTILTASGENALTFTAKTAGAEAQIAGLSISITDREGNAR
ncbi:MAG: flagellin, partial [Selenomonadaceae bacterium]|nr:flagellin [Selenomonadaceae bacterium]